MSTEDLRWIQAFKLTHELAWNTLKDFLEDMIKSRNLTTHTYDELTAAQIASAIRNSYFAEFEALRAGLEHRKREKQR